MLAVLHRSAIPTIRSGGRLMTHFMRVYLGEPLRIAAPRFSKLLWRPPSTPEEACWDLLLKIVHHPDVPVGTKAHYLVACPKEAWPQNWR
jgi:hypothetical protein